MKLLKQLKFHRRNCVNILFFFCPSGAIVAPVNLSWKVHNTIRWHICFRSGFIDLVRVKFFAQNSLTKNMKYFVLTTVFPFLFSLAKKKMCNRKRVESYEKKRHWHLHASSARFNNNNNSVNDLYFSLFLSPHFFCELLFYAWRIRK